MIIKEKQGKRKKNIRVAAIILSIAFLVFLGGYVLKITGADILSVNSGTGTNVTVTPNQFTEGGFSNPNFPPAGGGGEVPPVVSRGGRGGAGGGVVTAGNISVSPSQFYINILINTNIQKSLSVTNLGANSRSISITQTNLDNMIIIENASFSLAQNETKIVGLIFVAPNATGVYNGTINVGNITIPVSLNVLKEFILFDSNIVVLNKNYQVQQGEPLQTEVTLIPMGGAVRMDVILNYAVKDINGTTYLTRSETLLVDSQKSIRRDFDTGSLPLGQYRIELELIYPYGVAPSSAHFNIIASVRTTFSSVVYWILLAIILVSIMLIVLTIVRIMRKARQVNYEQQVSSY